MDNQDWDFDTILREKTDRIIKDALDHYCNGRCLVDIVGKPYKILNLKILSPTQQEIICRSVFLKEKHFLPYSWLCDEQGNIYTSSELKLTNNSDHCLRQILAEWAEPTSPAIIAKASDHFLVNLFKDFPSDESVLEFKVNLFLENILNFVDLKWWHTVDRGRKENGSPVWLNEFKKITESEGIDKGKQHLIILFNVILWDDILERQVQAKERFPAILQNSIYREILNWNNTLDETDHLYYQW